MNTTATAAPADQDIFSLDPSPTFWADVPLTKPGQAEPVIVQMQFVHQDNDELAAWLEANKGRTNLEALSAVVRNWRRIDVAYTQEALAKLFTKYPASALETFRAYVREQQGSKVKNS